MCDTVAGFLPAYVAGEEALDPRTLAHVAECIRCQAEIARYRRMLRTLHALKLEREPPPQSVVGSIAVGLDQPAGAGRAWVLVAGLATAAGAMGAAGVLIWFGRKQSPA
jgi:anti-sigma factor RsiW